MVNGTPGICAACAAHTIQPVAAAHCAVCSQTLAAAGAVCGNVICGWPPERRFFTRVDAVAMYSGSLEAVLKRFKYPPSRPGWAAIFGRLLVGWLETHADRVADIDLIVGNPTHATRQPFQHIEMIMRAAAAEDTAQRWPLAATDPPPLVKTAETPRSAACHREAKMEAARRHAKALALNTDVSDQRILLVDDVFTTGAQFHTVGRYLIETGHAHEVRGLVLARVPWS
ncbi:ComF family protein [Embleya sp. NBC_00896]|uniref:ComF family protein n=1 Tax=Embleya sp. NBC_00896 TaxID=2975961 RepID=UPI002F9081E8|nr:ComF family protein [Embleya sp. NBC_00896]